MREQVISLVLFITSLGLSSSRYLEEDNYAKFGNYSYLLNSGRGGIKHSFEPKIGLSLWKIIDLHYVFTKEKYEYRGLERTINETELGIDGFPLNRIDNLPINVKIGYVFYQKTRSYAKITDSTSTSKDFFHGFKIGLVGDIKIADKVNFVHDGEYGYYRGRGGGEPEVQYKIDYGGGLSVLVLDNLQILFSPRVEFWETGSFVFRGTTGVILSI